jgi:hypothetical protein
LKIVMVSYVVDFVGFSGKFWWEDLVFLIYCEIFRGFRQIYLFLLHTVQNFIVFVAFSAKFPYFCCIRCKLYLFLSQNFVVFALFGQNSLFPAKISLFLVYYS